MFLSTFPTYQNSISIPKCLWNCGELKTTILYQLCNLVSVLEYFNNVYISMNKVVVAAVVVILFIIISYYIMSLQYYVI